MTTHLVTTIPNAHVFDITYEKGFHYWCCANGNSIANNQDNF